MKGKFSLQISKDAPQKNFTFFDHIRKVIAIADIFFVETLIPTCLFSAPGHFDQKPLIILATLKKGFAP